MYLKIQYTSPKIYNCILASSAQKSFHLIGNLSVHYIIFFDILRTTCTYVCMYVSSLIEVHGNKVHKGLTDR